MCKRLRTGSVIAALSLCSMLAMAPVSDGAITPSLTAITQVQARSSSTLSSATDPDAPVPVAASTLPPTGRRLSSDEILAIASKLSKMRKVRAEYKGSYGGAYLKGPGRWQVSYFSRNGKKEIGQVIIADANGKVLEQWTGFQVAWTMARGYPGAFGKHVNSLYIWLPLCLLFLAPFVDWRRPFSLLHLDLLVLLFFSVSLAFFNHANIYASVPLVYPPLIYLLVRMLLLAHLGSLARGDRAKPEIKPSAAAYQPVGMQGSGGRLAPYEGPPRQRPYGSVPVAWMAIGVIFLLGFRIGLNVTDSNVIDVGYAGVIGAQKVVKGEALYGDWPSDNEHGDTYGPVNYEAYIPFEQIFGWSGTWDDLPAAHAAAIAFDLLAVGLMFLLGLRLRGPTLGVSLAYAWVSYPFTLYALESNSNDTLVAVFVLGALLLATSAPARGVLGALAGLTKFAPLALMPLLATHDLRALHPRQRPKAFVLFLGAFALSAAVVSIPAVSGDSLHTIFGRTITYQANRDSPFSVWGLYGGLNSVQKAVQIGAVILALSLAVIPRRSDVIGLTACCAAVIIAAQLSIDHWFYLYIPWFFALVMVVLLGSITEKIPEPPPLFVSEPSASSSLSRPVAIAAP
jgi:hypothetical protein